MAEALNYAKQYADALAQAYPFMLNFGDLWNTENKAKYRVLNAKTIEIPVLDVTGRVDGNRDTIGSAKRRHKNDWEPKELKNHRMWDTLVHPMDVNQTNMVASIANATKVYNETQKFPEMDAYTISMLHTLKVAKDSGSDSNTVLTAENILTEFDKAMEAMDEARVPATGRLLYVTPAVKTLLKNAQSIQRTIDLGSGASALKREVSRIDEVTIKVVPSVLMKTTYNFTDGWKPGDSAKQIRMFLCHPTAVLPVVSYSFAGMSEPTAMTQGKYVYFEESFEDIFILNRRSGALFFNVEA